LDTLVHALSETPVAKLAALLGIVFLLIAVLGDVAGKVQPGRLGRIGAAIIGILLLASAVGLHARPSERGRGVKSDHVSRELHAPVTPGRAPTPGSSR